VINYQSGAITMTQTSSSSGQLTEKKRNISDDTVLKIAKEIAVKFIEVGRITPSTFNDTFQDIHRTIEETVQRND
jgi:hypothetical protein